MKESIVRLYGMDYERLSRHAEKLLTEHHSDWHTIVEDLVWIKAEMQRQLRIPNKNE